MDAAQSKSDKLAHFLREVSNWNWEEFCRAENDPKYTSNEAIIFAVVRACAMEKMDAIKIALNRIDGKLKTPIRIEYPKIFVLYPNAKLQKMESEEPVEQRIIAPGKIENPEPEKKEPEEALPSLSLRQTLLKMSDHPRQVPEAVIEYATATQQWLLGKDVEPIEKPLVKSVVAAHLLKLAQERNINALSEVFDQIDGKLVETLQILGEDIYMVNYSLNAPDGAYLNADGIFQVEAINAQDTWAQKLDRS